MTADEVYRPSPVKRVRSTRAQLANVDDAIVAAVADEHPVTLRGVYYRAVSAGAIDKTEAAYKLIGRQLIKLRRNGSVPYSWITDGTRLMRKPSTWTDLDEMLDTASASYRRALWDNQSDAVIVLSEKDAISGVVYPVTSQWDVELGIVRGYSSETFTHSIAETVRANDDRGKRTYIYQLGDHDPSGVDAWRDFRDKVEAFVTEDDGVGWAGRFPVEFERLAVTPEQITELDLPTRPTKAKDSRAKSFTGESVEVDAIPAPTLREIVADAIVRHIDPEALRLTRIAERSERNILSTMIGRSS
jgi:hypothetical protein